MKRPSYIGRLNAEDTAKIHRRNERAAAELSKSGLSTKAIQRRIQTDLKDVYQRKSLACAYEQARIQRWLPRLLLNEFDETENLYLVTLGRTQDRVSDGWLKSFDPDNLVHQFRGSVVV